MRAALYARYSSDLQDKRSIRDQLDVARGYAERQGWRIVREFSDAAISGASTHNRPGLRDLMHAAEAGEFEVVLVEALDRLSRDLADIATIFKELAFAGVRLFTVADAEVTPMHIGLKGTISELFLRDLAQKTKRGQVGRVKAGRIATGRCYGYDVVREIVDRGRRTINEAEAEIVRRIYAHYVAGVSPATIVQALNGEGIKGPRGGGWNISTLIGSAKRRNGILNNELYAGRIVYGRQSSSRTRAQASASLGPTSRLSGSCARCPSWPSWMPSRGRRRKTCARAGDRLGPIGHRGSIDFRSTPCRD
jgi:DNA invertase Pin-like site-specific DNA recombinase